MPAVNSNYIPQRCSSMSLLNSSIVRKLRIHLKRFKRSEDGLITIEAVLMVPVLFWSLTASYTFFNSYHQSARNLKAAYAVADIISRERGTITSTYVETLYSLMQNMVEERSDMNMRISFLRYDKPDKRHYVLWSCARGADFTTKWDNGNIHQLEDRLPTMPDNGKMIVVETSNLYRPPFKLLVTRPPYYMNNFVFTHPRVFDNINAENNC